MDEAAIIRYIAEAFDEIDSVEHLGDTYFFYEPGGATPPERKFPFATLVTGDRHDTDSNLDRPSIFRLNIGVSKQTFLTLFGAPAAEQSGHDFTALDRLMPHPVYGKMYWICVLNPGPETTEQVKSLLAEAHGIVVAKHADKAKPPAES